jgi:hypothetical protein
MHHDRIEQLKQWMVELNYERAPGESWDNVQRKMAPRIYEYQQFQNINNNELTNEILAHELPSDIDLSI